MAKTLSSFAPIPGQTGPWSAQKGSLRCTAVRLADGSLCLYSPVLGLGQRALDSLAALGPVSHLLAPNHYHHKGLKEYAAAFPEAQLVCSDHARPRLQTQTGLRFAGLDGLIQRLPKGSRLAQPEGLKTGEVWVVSATEQGRTWVVCDSFKGPDGPVGSVADRVEWLWTFPKFGIKDRSALAAWVEAELASGAPGLIVPCHGALVRGEHLAGDIKALLQG